MARIKKTDHATILTAVDIDNRKVAEVAAEYGCTPANIYALLAKLRQAKRQEAVGSTTDASKPPKKPVPAVAEAQAEIDSNSPLKSSRSLDLFAEPQTAKPTTPRLAKRTTDVSPQHLAVEPSPAHIVDAATPAPATSLPSEIPSNLVMADAPSPGLHSVPKVSLPQRGAGKSRGGIGSALAKPGFGLTMRTAEGDENLTPFRSLDDLLSAVKPILRAAARSPDAVWFSIQPVDLATLDSDAA
jgi:hypothetical protein